MEPFFIRKQFRSKYEWNTAAEKVSKIQLLLILLITWTTQPTHSNAARTNFDQLPTGNTNQFIIFQEIGEMAADLSYIHVTIPLNITTLYQQGDLYKDYLTTMANSTTSKTNRIPFTKAVRDAGEFGIRSLDRIVTNLKDIDYNLVHTHPIHKRDIIDDYYARKLRQQQNQRIREDWARRAEYRKQQTPEYLDNLETKIYISQTLEKINKLLNPPEPNYPEDSPLWEAYAKETPTPTSTFRPFKPLSETEKEYLSEKSAALSKVYWKLVKMDEEEERLTNQTPDWYIQTRQKRFIQAFKLINDVVGTFMGAFNAYEIRQLKSKFNDLSSGHNMLVRVTQKHEQDIHKIAKSMQQVIDVIDTLADYNPGYMMQQINEQLAGFQDRVTKVTNTIQQLHHRRLAVDLLTPEQMALMHSQVETAAAVDNLNSLIQHTSDYFQVEVTYLRNDEDLIIIVHVPCIKIKELLKIYKHLSFPIPLPITPPTHDLTIRQAIQIDNFQNFTEKQLDNIFDQNDLDYTPVPEALFISDTTDLIAIGADDDYHVLTQLDLAGCSKRNHVYLCDKLQVARTDLTQTCLGSLFLRQENGVRAHCKFETKPIQELVFRISDTDHVIFSPMDQASIIKCNNGTQERVQFNKNQATKIQMGLGCELKLNKHTLKTKNTASIHIQPLQYSWSWDPFNLPSKTLTDSIHMDQVIYQIKKNIYALTDEIANSSISDNEFENMLSTATFSLNPTSIIIWTILCMSSFAILTLFSIAVYFYFFKKPNPMQNLQQIPLIPQNPLSELQQLLAANPNLIQELTRILNTNTQRNINQNPNQPLALAHFH